MGEVYLAEDTQLERTMTLKILPTVQTRATPTSCAAWDFSPEPAAKFRPPDALHKV